MHRLTKLTIDLYAKLCAFGAGFSIALMFVIVFVNATRRYLLGKSFEWGEELPVYLTIYGVMFGCALGYLQDKHVRLAILTDPLPEKIKKLILPLVDIAMIVTGFFLMRSGWLFMKGRGQIESSGLIGSTKDIAEASGISWIAQLGLLYPWQFALALGGALFCLAAFLKLIDRLLDFREESA